MRKLRTGLAAAAAGTVLMLGLAVAPARRPTTTACGPPRAAPASGSALRSTRTH
ncbi:hypothetical protein HH310_31320 [Actinoplanes sp. TBRC 11911]|uniref:hypothetical protein n=1 Tax=Actinoplanes sp. TBRC 11911 TaxID=2729386 RepID=UPI00145C5D9E|nr:hypothetical protein [Actinoplanes sp. TBRC 11911]NMO55661.1 hypothetical protein [Actinoplanes sp. TBRC 11911]